MTTATATSTNQDKALREQLVKLLSDSEAHANFETAVKDMPADLQGKRPKGAAHSPWEMLEHLRIAQWDILEFARNAKHKSPEFPAGYWPKSPEPPDAKAWEKSAAAFQADRKALCDLIEQRIHRPVRENSPRRRPNDSPPSPASRRPQRLSHRRINSPSPHSRRLGLKEGPALKREIKLPRSLRSAEALLPRMNAGAPTRAVLRKKSKARG